MKDQRAILIKCIENDEPAFVIAGHDVFAIATMQAYYDIAKDNGAADDFLEDMQLVINEMKAFHKEEPGKVHIPTLKSFEKHNYQLK